MTEYEVIWEDGQDSVGPAYDRLFNAYKGLVDSRTCEDVKKVVLAIGTSVAEEKIGIKSASLIILFAQMKFSVLNLQGEASRS